MQRLALVFLSALLIFWAFPPSTAESRLRKFYTGSKQTDRTTAAVECRRNYTDLVTVYDHQDNKELAELLNNSNVFNAWIGASIGGNKKRKWSNGDDVTFNNSLIGDCGETCCAALKANGEWESNKCIMKKYFMCYKQDGGQESYNYSLIHENKAWFEAQLYCREHYTDLVTIRNDEENTAVMEEGQKQHNNPFWIGLLVDSVEWADGGQSAYRNRLSQDESGDKHLVFMDNSGKWHKIKGNNCHPLCYKSFIHVSTDAKTWEEALDYCNSHKNTTGLLSIQSQRDQREIERELKRPDHNISGPMWVGLRQSRLFGFWIWINGVTVGPWTNWKGGIAPVHQISHHCGAIEEVNGQYKWTDKDCRSKLGVLCEGK